MYLQTWNSAKSILPKWEALTGQSLSIDNLINLFHEDEMDLYFYEKSQVLCDYDWQFLAYRDYLAECEVDGTKPVSRSEYLKNFPQFDTLDNFYTEVNKFGNSIELPIYHAINEIVYRDFEEKFFCMSVLEKGACFDQFDETNHSSFPIELFTESQYGGAVKGYELSLDNVFFHIDDLTRFEKNRQQSFLEINEPVSTESNTNSKVTFEELYPGAGSAKGDNKIYVVPVLRSFVNEYKRRPSARELWTYLVNHVEGKSRFKVDEQTKEIEGFGNDSGKPFTINTLQKSLDRWNKTE